MADTVNELTKGFSEERLARIRAKSDAFIAEYSSLMDFRQAAGLTQEQLAERVSVSQESISRLEKRTDMHLSTLRRYIEAMGYELELTAVRKNDEGLPIKLDL